MTSPHELFPDVMRRFREIETQAMAELVWAARKADPPRCPYLERVRLDLDARAQEEMIRCRTESVIESAWVICARPADHEGRCDHTPDQERVRGVRLRLFWS